MNSRMILSLEDITLSFGGKPLFEGLSLHINARDRIALVGKNGVGKTTLMRLMMQDLELDAGKRFVLPGTRIGYLAQRFDFNPESTVHEFVLSGLPEDEQHDYNEYLADIVIEPLGLDASARMGRLSGGQLRRAGLAQALVHEPDILLLDEPTNHLDLQAIEWLEGYLASYPGALLCVSHDRTFLATITRKVFWVDRGNVLTCPHGFGGFDDWLEKHIEQEARALQNLAKKVEAEQSWTQGGVSGRRKRNVRRLRELGRLREKLKADKAAYKQRSQKLSMDALDAPTASKVVAEFKGVSKHFIREDGRTLPILDDFRHIILKGDRLGILGKNGSGKSTFLRLLTGELEPDKGNLFRSKHLQISYFDQNRSALDPKKSLWETLCPQGGSEVVLGHGEDERRIHVCGYLKKFMFDPKIAHDKVGSLSGGQQNRLLLAKILAQPGNLLILDEPTNDLDMDTLDMLQDMLADFPGTLILVSHDRDFLDRSVTELLAFEGDGEIMHVFGGYSDYLRATGKQKSSDKPAKKTETQPIKQETQSVANKPKPLTYGEGIELKKLPEEIDALQQKLEAIQAQLDETGLYERDPNGFHQTIAQFDAIKQDIATKEARWLELEERQLAAD